MEKMMTYGLGKQTVKYIENWINGWEHGMVISAAKSSWRPLTSSALQSCLTHSWMIWTMGQIIRSVSLQMTQYWYKWLIGGPFRGTWTDQRTGMTGTSWSSTKEVQSPAPGEEQLQAPIYAKWGLAGNQLLKKTIWESQWTPSWTRASDVRLPQRMPTVSLAELGEMPHTVWGWWSLLSTQHFQGHS